MVTVGPRDKGPRINIKISRTAKGSRIADKLSVGDFTVNELSYDVPG